MKAETFDYELVCAYCEAKHAAVQITIPAGEQYVEWAPPCGACGRVNKFRFDRAPQTKLKDDRPRSPQE